MIRRSPPQEHGMKPAVSDTSFGLCPVRARLFPSSVPAAAVALGTGQPEDAHAMPAKPSGSLQPTTSSFEAETDRPQQESGAAQEQSPKARPMDEPRRSHSVLVVEDDPDIAMALQDLLEFEGFHVDWVQTCRQAFSFVDQNVYNAVLLDLGLPDGDGCSILEQLQGSHPSLPVIVLTASNRDLGPLRAYARLSKPWNRAELCGILHRAVGTTS